MATSTRWKIAQIAERKWWQNYLQKKEVVSYLLWKKKYWQILIDICNPFFTVQATDTILDAGCGPAGIFMCFPNNKVTAFDPLLASYQADLPHFDTKMYANVKFETIGLEAFTSSETYQVVYCMNAINHVQNIEKAYDVLCNQVQTNGYLVVTIDAHNHHFLKKIFKLLPGDVLHPHQYDLQEYNNFLTQRGMQIVATQKLKKEFFFDHYIQIAVKKN